MLGGCYIHRYRETSNIDLEGRLRSYVESCRGCLISQGIDPDVNKSGGIIELDGGWIINHYGGSEGFLGWLSLQPRFHRMDLADLTMSEVASLGRHIQNVDQALRQYWSIRFERDPIQRVYVAYFHESVFGFSDSNAQSQEWHMHLHIIPRTVELGRVLRGFGPDGSIRAWSVPEVVAGSGANLPPEYEKTDQKMSALIADLRRYLATPRGK